MTGFFRDNLTNQTDYFEDQASEKATEAAASATAAAASATASAASAASAQATADGLANITSQVNTAQQAATDANGYQSAALTAKNDAVSARNAAQTAQTAAETAKGAAETAQAAAVAAQGAATTQSGSATTSATSATNSASSASASASAASASAGAASTSASSATSSASTATTKAAEASASAAAALVSEGNASTSASAASTSSGAASTSASAASASASAASASETAAGTSATAAASSATNAATSATNAAASFDSFDDRYLGAKATAPALDNDGDALITGALYFDTTAELVYVYTGSSWVAAGSAVNGTSERQTYTATSGQTTFAITYDIGFVDAYLNGVKLLAGTDFTATSGTNVVLTTGAAAGDIVDIVAYGSFNLANTYTQTAADAKFAQVANNLSDLSSASTALTNLGLTATATDINRLDITTEGASEASKVVTADSNGNVFLSSGYLLASGGPIYTTAAFYGDVDALTSSSNTLTIPFNAANTFTHTLTENTTIAVGGVAPSYVSTAVLYVVQDASASGYTLSFPSGTRYVGATAPTLTATASAVDVLVLHYHSSVLHVYVAGQDVKA